MGTALAAALGVAEKRPERDVIALLGDGEALMGAGSFWSLAGIAPPNLLAVVLVDGHYTITGDQPLGVPDVFGDVAAALGLRTATARTYEEVAAQCALRASRGARGPLRRARRGPARRRSSTRRSSAGASSRRRLDRLGYRARGAILRAAESPRVNRVVSRHGMRLGARRFVPAESLDEIVPIFRELNARGLRAVTGLFDDYALDPGARRRRTRRSTRARSCGSGRKGWTRTSGSS